MKKIWSKGCRGALLFAIVLFWGMTVQAGNADTIKTGVYADGIDLSGKTEAEATAAIEEYVEGLKQTQITLLAADNKEVTVTAEQLGISWENPELVKEALEIGTHGNVIERYKLLKDLEHEGAVLDVELAYDVQAINAILTEKCVKYDKKAVNVSLKRENGQFQVVAGQTGYVLDVEASIDSIYDYLMEEWDGQPCTIALDVVVDEPKGSAEELAQVKDVLGTFTTSYKTSGSSRSANVQNGAKLIDGTTLYPGEEFSTYEAVSPFSEANGYYMAGSYLNGKVVDSLGGGICQVSTTLYNAVLLAELDVTERHNHSMIVTYVDPSADAAIAESAGKDFCFVNNTEAPVYIEGYTTSDKKIVFNIYGKETRDPGRKVRYESEVLETIQPAADKIYADAGQPIGYIVAEGAHVGYKARLWKVVTENGKEVSRTQVNSSSYKMSPRSATVGVATTDPHAQEQIMAAIGTSNIDHVRNVIAALTAPPASEHEEEDE
ncbi:MAG: VanW family protein [Lachnospiraceae bacterium]|nr:VanW family protein [Lachnospiraceae bacterium]